MKITKTNSVVKGFMSKDLSRINLAAVHVTSDYIEASDGYKMLRITSPNPDKQNINIVVESLPEQGELSADGGWVDGSTQGKVGLVDCDYPDVNTVIPTDTPQITVGVDGNFLKSVADAYVKWSGKSKTNTLILEVRGPLNQIVFKSFHPNDAGETFLAIFMPQKILEAVK